MLLVTAAAIPILILCSAMTSASETAVTALSEARIRQMAREGNRRAVILASLLDDKERLIGVLLIANNIFNILSASLATNVFLHLTGEVGVAIATVIMTVLVVVFAEVLPKTYAIRDSEKFVHGLMTAECGSQADRPGHPQAVRRSRVVVRRSSGHGRTACPDCRVARLFVQIPAALADAARGDGSRTNDHWRDHDPSFDDDNLRW